MGISYCNSHSIPHSLSGYNTITIISTLSLQRSPLSPRSNEACGHAISYSANAPRQQCRVLTGWDARLGVKRLENKDLIWHLLCSVVPLMAWIMEHVERLANKVRIDNIGRNKICLRERTGIHHPKRPVFYWAKEGPPNTGKRSEHIVLTRKPCVLTSRSGNACSPALRLQRVRNALLTCVVRCLA
jgi:hypothetical protein